MGNERPPSDTLESELGAPAAAAAAAAPARVGSAASAGHAVVEAVRNAASHETMDMAELQALLVSGMVSCFHANGQGMTLSTARALSSRMAERVAQDIESMPPDVIDESVDLGSFQCSTALLDSHDGAPDTGVQFYETNHPVNGLVWQPIDAYKHLGAFSPLAVVRLHQVPSHFLMDACFLAAALEADMEWVKAMVRLFTPILPKTTGRLYVRALRALGFLAHRQDAATYVRSEFIHRMTLFLVLTTFNVACPFGSCPHRVVYPPSLAPMHTGSAVVPNAFTVPQGMMGMPMLDMAGMAHVERAGMFQQHHVLCETTPLHVFASHRLAVGDMIRLPTAPTAWLDRVARVARPLIREDLGVNRLKDVVKSTGLGTPSQTEQLQRLRKACQRRSAAKPLSMHDISDKYAQMHALPVDDMVEQLLELPVLERAQMIKALLDGDVARRACVGPHIKAALPRTWDMEHCTAHTLTLTYMAIVMATDAGMMYLRTCSDLNAGPVKLPLALEEVLDTAMPQILPAMGGLPQRLGLLLELIRTCRYSLPQRLPEAMHDVLYLSTLADGASMMFKKLTGLSPQDVLQPYHLPWTV